MAETRTPGLRITRMRETHQMTREALAERSGITIEQLTRIEEGGLTPDLAPLVKIARALGVRLGTFMDDQEELGPVLSRGGDVRPTVRFTGTGNAKVEAGMAYASLAPGKGGRHMEPFIIDIRGSAPKSGSLDADSTHEGEEFVYVLEGSVEVRYGSEKYTLSVGDSIYYDSIVPHRVSSGDGKDARILAVVYAPF